LAVHARVRADFCPLHFFFLGWQGRADTFVYIVLSVMPWAGRDLSERDDANFDTLMSDIGTYLRCVSRARQAIKFLHCLGVLCSLQQRGRPLHLR